MALARALLAAVLAVLPLVHGTGGKATPPVIDVAALPLGAPPAVTYAVGRELHWRGRSIETDYPAGHGIGTVLGVAGGRLVVDAGDRFWGIDPSGHAVRLGRSYQSYDYAPRLVRSTAHLWVHYEDRTTPRTIWEIDARTGRQLAAYPHNEVPRGLAPADQALVDAWVARRDVVPDTTDRTDRGRLEAGTTSRVDGDGTVLETVSVRRVGGSRLAAFTFASTDGDGVGRVLFEDRQHVLVLTTVSATRRGGPQQAVVRCSVTDGSCELATPVGGQQSLGVVRPQFAPAGAH